MQRPEKEDKMGRAPVSKLMLFATYEKLLQASGHSVHSTVAQVAGAVTNIVLDPVMIYGLLGCPEFGARGAAYATVTGQWVLGLLGLLFHLQVNRRVMSHSLRYYKPNGTIIRGIYAIGLPAIIAQALMSVMTYGLNIILVAVRESLVTAYGLYYKIQQFILFAAFGLRDAITPIVAFANGMGNKPRIREGIKYGQLYTFAIMLAGTAAVELFAVPCAYVFGLNGETEALCVSAMRIISVSFVFAGANLAMQGMFQALDGGVESLIVSLSRQIVFVLPTAWLFAQTVLRTRTSPATTRRCPPWPPRKAVCPRSLFPASTPMRTPSCGSCTSARTPSVRRRPPVRAVRGQLHRGGEDRRADLRLHQPYVRKGGRELGMLPAALLWDSMGNGSYGHLRRSGSLLAVRMVRPVKAKMIAKTKLE